jgi:thiamine-phosphate diphosphorylase/hydroxyethylthiazole kinase
MTGAVDYVSDGDRVFEIANGVALLGDVTGTGCALGTTISAAVAAYPDDKLAAVVAGILHYELAAEQAAARPEVRGPGTFVPAFLDELFAIRAATVREEQVWFGTVKIARVYPNV